MERAERRDVTLREAVVVEVTEASLDAIGADRCAEGSIAHELLGWARNGDAGRVRFLVKFLHDRMDDGEWEEHAMLLTLLEVVWSDGGADTELIRLCRELTRYGRGSARVQLVATLPVRGEWAGRVCVEELLEAAASAGIGT
jgi:hypothetical protein